MSRRNSKEKGEKGAKEVERKEGERKRNNRERGRGKGRCKGEIGKGVNEWREKERREEGGKMQRTIEGSEVRKTVLKKERRECEERKRTEVNMKRGKNWQKERSVGREGRNRKGRNKK